MAREIRIVRKGGRRGPDSRRPPVVGPEPQTTEEARRAIEQTRGRISSTLDAIEDRIGDAREEIKDRVDVITPVRERIRSNRGLSLGIAFGAGLLLALVTGGGEERRRAHRSLARRLDESRGMLDEDEREELRHWRAERRERLRREGILQPARATQPLRAIEHEDVSGFELLRDAIAQGVMAGLGDRWRRSGRAGGR